MNAVDFARCELQWKNPAMSVVCLPNGFSARLDREIESLRRETATEKAPLWLSLPVLCSRAVCPVYPVRRYPCGGLPGRKGALMVTCPQLVVIIGGRKDGDARQERAKRRYNRLVRRLCLRPIPGGAA